jgi:uncharacterized protein (TIGR02996 family)
MTALDNLLIESRMFPEDDPVRLILADWLEEHGDHVHLALAEFIRGQVKISRVPTHHPEYQDLIWRDRQIWWNHVESAHWLGLLYHACERFEFRRGFARLWLRGKQMSAWDDPEAVLALPNWRWVDDVRIANPSVTQLAEFFASSAVAWLACLEITDCSTRWKEDFRLPDEEFPPVLQRLAVRNSLLDDWILGTLVRWHGAVNLQVLDLANNRLGSNAVHALASSQLRQLRELDLQRNPIGYQHRTSLTGFFQSPVASQLAKLNLSATNLQPESVTALVNSTAMNRLTWLDLSNNHLSDRAMEAIAESPGASQLRTLLLGNNTILTPGIRALVTSAFLENLEVLGLEGVDLDTEAVQALVNESRLYSLRELRLSRSGIGGTRQWNQLRGRFGYAIVLD